MIQWPPFPWEELRKTKYYGGSVALFHRWFSNPKVSFFFQIKKKRKKNIIFFFFLSSFIIHNNINSIKNLLVWKQKKSLRHWNRLPIKSELPLISHTTLSIHNLMLKRNKKISYIEFEMPCYYYLIFIFHMAKA